ncbi:Uncharacterised protein [Shigella sonnei]|nr:Uncharacterised protein [Shigella sonnei]
MPFHEITRPICSEPTTPTPHRVDPVPAKLCPIPRITRPRQSNNRLMTGRLAVNPAVRYPRPLKKQPHKPKTTIFLGPSKSA